jgi:hypothetical protein
MAKGYPESERWTDDGDADTGAGACRSDGPCDVTVDHPLLFWLGNPSCLGLNVRLTHDEIGLVSDAVQMG